MNKMNPQETAAQLGVTFAPLTRGYLNLCIRSGNLLITSGHVSDLKGKLGAGLEALQRRPVFGFWRAGQRCSRL